MTLRQRIEREAARARPEKVIRDLLLLPFFVPALVIGVMLRILYVVAKYVQGAVVAGWRIAWGKPV